MSAVARLASEGNRYPAVEGGALQTVGQLQAVPVAPPAPSATAAQAPIQDAVSTPPVALPVRKDPTFNITRFEFSGAKWVREDVLRAAVANLVGEGRRFSVIEDAVQAVRDAYDQAGATAVRVVIPEQELTAGVVKLEVQELPLTKVEIEGARARSSGNIRRAVPSLREGTMPVDTLLAEEIRLANENSGRQMQMTLRTEEDDSITGVLRVADRNNVSGLVSLDNTGSSSTGRWRLGALAQHHNLLDRDVVVTFQVQTSPGYEKEVRIASTSLRIPFYSLGVLLDASVTHSSVDSGNVSTAAGTYYLASQGGVYGLKLTRLLPRISSMDHRVSLAYDVKAVDSKVASTPGGDSLIPSLILRPITLSYAASYAGTRLNAFGSLSVSRNVPGAGRSAASTFQEPGLRAGAKPDFHVLRATAGAAWPMLGATANLNFSGQWTDNALMPAELFSIGGDNSIRGMPGRLASSDTGYRLGFDLATPPTPAPPPLPFDIAAVLFADMGEVRRNLPLPGERVRISLQSAGLGLRVTWKDRMSWRVDLGGVTRGDGVVATGSAFVHTALTYGF